MVVEAPTKQIKSTQLPNKTVPLGVKWWVSVALWWLLPVTILLYVAQAGYTTLVTPRFGHANTVTGDLLSGESVGQSFVARYDNLSGVELWLGTNNLQKNPDRPEIVVHLYSGSPPERGTLLATSVLPGRESLEDNPWYLFSFSPVPGSRGQSYYVEVESPDARVGRAITLFSWHSAIAGGGDPYANGTLYRNGEPISGDLAFGLRYSPSPAGLWIDVARNVSANFPVAAMLSILAAMAALILWAVFRLPLMWRKRGGTRTWLSRWSLPIVLVIGLLNGVTYVLVVPPWQGPDEHAHFTYAALLDRHGLDDAVVQQLQTSGNADDALVSAIHSSMDRHNFTRLLAGDSRPGAPANTGRSAYWELRQPTAYYWLCAASLSTLRYLGLNVDPFTNPEGALFVMRFVSLLLSLGVATLAWVAAVLITSSRSPTPGPGTTVRNGHGSVPSEPHTLAPDDSTSLDSLNMRLNTADAPPGGEVLWLRIALPLTVMLFPMHAFMASMANNDILAELAVSAVFVALVALFRWPLGVRGVVLLTTAGLLTASTVATKQSALAAAIPLFGLGLIWWCGRVASHFWARRSAGGGESMPITRRQAAFIVGILLLTTIATATVLIIGPDEGAVGWNGSVWPIAHAHRQPTDSAIDGSFVLQLEPEGSASTAFQMLLPSVYHPALTAHLTAWARVVPSEGEPLSEPSHADILIREGSRTTGGGSAILDRSGTWTRVTITGTISESGRQVIIRLGGTGPRSIQYDDLSLKLESASGPWEGTLFGGRLLNPSFEAGSVAVHPTLVSFLPDEVWQMVDVALNDQPFHKLELWRHYADMEYRSFWGNFGWVSVPLPEPVYVLLGILTIISLLGLAIHGLQRWDSWSHVEWLAVASLAAFLFAVLVGFARQTMGLSTLGIAAYPQGRYLFVLIVPICWLWIAGLFRFGLQSWRGARRLALGLFKSQNQAGSAPAHAELGGTNAAHTPRRLPWPLWLWLNLLVLFAGYCLLCLLVPYYYA